ncbi:MAG: hypothetical protein O2960_16535, partial [Verrucomicrobia bacterium]|nr:hypothetical protein [Verrucomicrobiota bacterium]
MPTLRSSTVAKAPTLDSLGGATLCGALLILVVRVSCNSELWKRRIVWMSRCFHCAFSFVF